MSRIGNKEIELPAGVKIEVKNDSVQVTGPKGTLAAPLFNGIKIEEAGTVIKVARRDDSKEQKAKHGLVRALLANCVTGLSKGFSKTLILQGTGYRAVKKGEKIALSLGYSHEINYDQPKDVQIDVPEMTKIVISGIDKQRVGQVAAQIRSYRKPEPYKGKGIRYENEKIIRKAGKAGKK